MNDAPALAHLEALPNVKRGSGGWSNARCPAHEDRIASFGWKTHADGKVGLNCHAGCNADEIVAALGLEMSDLFPPRTNGASGGPAHRATAPTKTYVICDRAGVVQAHHDRIEHADGSKDYPWRGPDGKPGLNGKRVDSLPLYGTELLDTWPESEPIVVVEGEKVRDALTDAGIQALGTVTGAKPIPDDTVLADLKGRNVVLWPDADGVGKDHMRRIFERLESIAAEVRWIEPPDDSPKGWDAADAIADRLDVKAMIAAAESQPSQAADDARLLPSPREPMAVARKLVDERYRTEDGKLTLLHWRGAFLGWRRSHWTEEPESSLEETAYLFTEHAVYTDKKGAPAKWSPNGRSIADLLRAMKAITRLPDDVEMPAWIGPEPWRVERHRYDTHGHRYDTHTPAPDSVLDSAPDTGDTGFSEKPTHTHTRAGVSVHFDHRRSLRGDPGCLDRTHAASALQRLAEGGG